MRKGQLLEEFKREKETVISTPLVQSESPLSRLSPVMLTAGSSEIDEDGVAPTTSGRRNVTVKEGKRRRTCNRDEVPGGGWVPVGGASGLATPGGAEILFMGATFVCVAGTVVSRANVESVVANSRVT